MASSFSCPLNDSLYSVNNGDYVTDDFLLVSRFHYEQHRYLRNPKIFVLFSSSLVAGIVSRIMSAFIAIVATDVLILSSLVTRPGLS